MAIIATSEIISDRVQAHGTRKIVERHIEADGTVHEFRWRAGAGADATAVLPARAAQLEQKLPADELERLTELVARGDTPPRPKYVDVAGLLKAIRNRYAMATGLEAGRIAAFLFERTTKELEIAFGLSSITVTQLKDRLTASKDALDAATALGGE